MNAWQWTTDHLGWIVTGLTAAGGYLLRRRATRADGTTVTPSGAPTRRVRATRLGRWLDAVREAERLRVELEAQAESFARQRGDWADERESFARQRTDWAAARAETERYLATLLERIDRLTQTAEAVTSATASLIESATPSPTSSGPPATSTPSSPKSSG